MNAERSANEQKLAEKHKENENALNEAQERFNKEKHDLNEVASLLKGEIETLKSLNKNLNDEKEKFTKEADKFKAEMEALKSDNSMKEFVDKVTLKFFVLLFNFAH